MNTGGARLIVIVAAVVIGILVLAKGLEGSAQTVSPPSKSPSAIGSPSPTVSGGATTSPGNNGGGQPSPRQSGVLVAIYNATNTDGLAGATATELQAKGYVLAGKPGNLTPSNETVIYYQNDQGKADAEHLKQLSIPEAKIKKLPKNLPAEASIPPKAELVIVLGSDYAQSHPING